MSPCITTWRLLLIFPLNHLQHYQNNRMEWYKISCNLSYYHVIVANFDKDL
ncbi:hypothetical protein BofuT4_uP101060.1 [Botrytis cinerea T4]|uniref:Uncharacterized protein n=1 Tax=Botryotinia fuckeliana (strain T4) TaxID=999810 RepID=G2YBW1_BOTF4|nr:hypothetical protein BofuT4_uP101060.1 [Botrytis cinerea T4]